MTRVGKAARRIVGTATVVVLAGIGAASLSAQTDTAKRAPAGVIDGLVSDTSLVPLDDVTVTIVGSDVHVVTGKNGRFRVLGVPAGRHTVLARRIGFEATTSEVDVRANQTVQPALMLEPLITNLNRVTVEVARRSPRLAEFEARRLNSNGGYFITAEQIDKRHVVAAADLLVGLPNILVNFTGMFGAKAISARNPIQLRCPMRVVVDGIPRGTDLGEIPSPKELAGIEVYHGPASMPLEYKRSDGSGKCGVILAWTKDGSP